MFAEGKVTSVGQIIAVVLAKDKPTADRAVQKAIVNYENLPAILTIEVIINIH